MSLIFVFFCFAAAIDGVSALPPGAADEEFVFEANDNMLAPQALDYCLEAGSIVYPVYFAEKNIMVSAPEPYWEGVPRKTIALKASDSKYNNRFSVFSKSKRVHNINIAQLRAKTSKYEPVIYLDGNFH